MEIEFKLLPKYREASPISSDHDQNHHSFRLLSTNKQNDIVLAEAALHFKLRGTHRFNQTNNVKYYMKLIDDIMTFAKSQELDIIFDSGAFFSISLTNN